MPVVAARAAVEASEGDATAAMFEPREEGEIRVCAKEHLGVVCVGVGLRDERKGVPRSKQRMKFIPSFSGGVVGGSA